MPNCGERFETTGKENGDSLALAMSKAGASAGQQAVDACKPLWNCRKVADLGVVSLDVAEAGQEWQVTYTGAFSCEKTQQDVTAKEQAHDPCGMTFEVTCTHPTEATAESRAQRMAKQRCAQLPQCNDLRQVSRNYANKTFRGMYQCVAAGTPVQPGTTPIR